MYNRFWEWITRFLEASVIGRLYFRMVHAISGAFHNSWIYNFFTDKDMVVYGNTAKIPNLVRKLIFESKFSEIVSDSGFVRFFSDFPDKVMASPVSVLSAYLIPSGLLMFVSGFGRVNHMLICAFIILIGICLLGIKKIVGALIGKSLLLGTICSFFDIKTDFKKNEHSSYIYCIAAVFGIIAGAVSFFVNANLSLIVFIALLLFPLIISSPLLIISLTMFAGMAFSTLPATAVAVLLFVIVVCRLFRKKEHLPRMRAPYILVILYSLLTLYYTFNTYGGSNGILAGIVQFFFLTVFFSVAVVINSKEKFKKLIYSLSVCTVYTSLYGLYQTITGQGGTGWANDTDYVGGLRRISSTFSNPNVYGEFLIFTVCVTITAILISKTNKQRLFFVCLLGLNLINLALTYSRGCYLAVIISVLIIIWCCDKRILGFGVFALPLLPRIIPKNIISRLLSITSYLEDSSIVYRFSIWRGSLRIIKNHWYIGSGIGVSSFLAFYRNYMLSGVTAQHSHNVFIQISIELSILGMILMLLIFLYTVRDVSYTVKYSGNMETKFILIPLIASFAGVFIEGLVDYIFYNNIVFLMFWLTLGLVIAGLNICSENLRVSAATEKGVAL